MALFHCLLCLRTAKNASRSPSPEEVHSNCIGSQCGLSSLDGMSLTPYIVILPRMCASGTQWAYPPLRASLRIWFLSGSQKAPSAMSSSFLFSVHPNSGSYKKQQMNIFSFVLSWGLELHPNDLQGGWHFQLNSAQSDRHNLSQETVRSCLLLKCYTGNDYNNNWFQLTHRLSFHLNWFHTGVSQQGSTRGWGFTSFCSPSPIWPVRGQQTSCVERACFIYFYIRLE